jgi:hypothetical protein
VPVPGALHRASRGRSWLLVVGEWQVLLSTDVTGLQTFAETFARMACLSPGRRLGVVGRRRGFFLSGAVPQNSAEAFAKVNRLEFQKLARVAGKIVSDSNAFAYGPRTGSSARLPQLKNCFC